MPVEQIKVIVPSVTVTWTKHSYIFLLLSGLLTHASQLWRGDLIQALCRKCFLESKWLASWRFSINGCSFQLVLLCKDSLQTEIFHSILQSCGVNGKVPSPPLQAATLAYLWVRMLLHVAGVHESHYTESWRGWERKAIQAFAPGAKLKGHQKTQVIKTNHI